MVGLIDIEMLGDRLGNDDSLGNRLTDGDSFGDRLSNGDSFGVSDDSLGKIFSLGGTLWLG